MVIAGASMTIRSTPSGDVWVAGTVFDGTVFDEPRKIGSVPTAMTEP
jgi:hypothetical protein